jgi:hypothetical protein
MGPQDMLPIKMPTQVPHQIKVKEQAILHTFIFISDLSNHSARFSEHTALSGAIISGKWIGNA